MIGKLLNLWKRACYGFRTALQRRRPNVLFLQDLTFFDPLQEHVAPFDSGTFIYKRFAQGKPALGCWLF